MLFNFIKKLLKKEQEEEKVQIRVKDIDYNKYPDDSLSQIERLSCKNNQEKDSLNESFSSKNYILKGCK